MRNMKHPMLFADLQSRCAVDVAWRYDSYLGKVVLPLRRPNFR